MREWPRSLVVLGSAFAAVLVVTLVAFAVVRQPDRSTFQVANGASPAAPGATDAGQPGTTSGIGGALTLSGDRTGTLTLDREVFADRYTLAGQDGQVAFEGQPATVSRIRLDGLEFYLDPADCETAFERDDSTGLVPYEVHCVEISDVRDTAVLTIQGTLRLPADQLGLRGDLSPTGGDVTVGDEVLTFDEASLDLRRPAIIETGPNSFSVNPPVYPVSVPGQGGTLVFEYDSRSRELRLDRIERADHVGLVGDPGCSLAYRELGELSPRVTVVDMTLACPAVETAAQGSAPLEGTLVIDIVGLPSAGLR